MPGEEREKARVEETVTLYRCPDCNRLGMGRCARGRCHGIPRIPGAAAKPIGDPVEGTILRPLSPPVATSREGTD